MKPVEIVIEEDVLGTNHLIHTTINLKEPKQVSTIILFVNRIPIGTIPMGRGFENKAYKSIVDFSNFKSGKYTVKANCYKGSNFSKPIASGRTSIQLKNEDVQSSGKGYYISMHEIQANKSLDFGFYSEHHKLFDFCRWKIQFELNGKKRALQVINGFFSLPIDQCVPGINLIKIISSSPFWNGKKEHKFEYFLDNYVPIIKLSTAASHSNLKHPKLSFYAFTWGSQINLQSSRLTYLKRPIESELSNAELDYMQWQNGIQTKGPYSAEFEELKERLISLDIWEDALNKRIQNILRIPASKLTSKKLKFEWLALAKTLIRETRFHDNLRGEINQAVFLNLSEILFRNILSSQPGLDTAASLVEINHSSLDDVKRLVAKLSLSKEEKDRLLKTLPEQLQIERKFSHWKKLLNFWTKVAQLQFDNKIETEIGISIEFTLQNILYGEPPWKQLKLKIAGTTYPGKNDFTLTIADTFGNVSFPVSFVVMIDRQTPRIKALNPEEGSVGIRPDSTFTIDIDYEKPTEVMSIGTENLSEVGEVKANHLKKSGLSSLGDILDFDPFRDVYSGIPLQEIQDICQKVKLLSTIHFSMTEIWPFSHLSISELMSFDPLTRVLPPGYPKETLMHVLEKAKVIHLCLDNSTCREISVGSFVKPYHSNIVRFELYLDGVEFTQHAVKSDHFLHFTPPQVLRDGIRELEIKVWDEANNKSEYKYTVDVDAAGPEFLIQSPFNDQHLNHEKVLLQFEVKDLKSGVDHSTLQVKVDDKDISVELTKNNNLYSALLLGLSEGKHVLDFFCKDQHGNVSEFVRRGFTIDRTPPKVTIDNNINYTATKETEIVLDLNVVEKNIASIQVQGHWISLSKSAPRKVTFALAFGWNDLWVEVKDKAGNKSASNHVLLYRVKPYECAAYGRITNGIQPLSNVKVSLPLNDQSVITNEDGRFVLGELPQVKNTLRFKPLDPALGEAFSIKINSKTNRIYSFDEAIVIKPSLVNDSEVVKVEIPETPGIKINVSDKGATIKLSLNTDQNMQFPEGTERKIGVKQADIGETNVPAPAFLSTKKVHLFTPDNFKVEDGDIPVEITTDYKLSPGAAMLMFSADKTTGEWIIAGLGKMSSDGRTYQSLPGAGIRHFSAVAVAPMPPVFRPRREENTSQDADVARGAVSTSIEIPGFAEMSTNIQPSLIYNSFAAAPKVVLGAQFKGLATFLTAPEVIQEQPLDYELDGTVQHQVTEVQAYRESKWYEFWEDSYVEVDPEDGEYEPVVKSNAIYVPLNSDSPFNEETVYEDLDGGRVRYKNSIQESEAFNFFKLHFKTTLSKTEESWIQAVSGKYFFASALPVSFEFEGALQKHGPLPYPGEEDKRRSFPTLPEDLDISYILSPQLEDGSYYPTGLYSYYSEFMAKAGGAMHVLKSVKSTGDISIDSGFEQYVLSQISQMMGPDRADLELLLDALELGRKVNESGGEIMKNVEVQYLDSPLELLLHSRAGSAIVHNLSRSVFGKGWRFKDQQHLIPIDSRRVLAIGPDGKKVFALEEKISTVGSQSAVAVCINQNGHVFSIAKGDQGTKSLYKINEQDELEKVLDFPAFEKKITQRKRTRSVNWVNEASPYNVGWTAYSSSTETSATESQPNMQGDLISMVSDSEGQIYVADEENNRIYKFDKQNNVTILNTPPREETSDVGFRFYNYQGHTEATSSLYDSYTYKSYYNQVTAAQRFVFRIDKLYCVHTNDDIGDDELDLYFRPDGHQYGPYSNHDINNGHTWNLGHAFAYNSYVQVAFWERDTWSDDHLGDLNYGTTGSASTSGVTDMIGGSAHYKLFYTLQNTYAHNKSLVMKMKEEEVTTITQFEHTVPGYTTDGSAISSAVLGQPSGIAVDADGNLLIAERANHRIRKFNFQTGLIETIAGNGTALYDISTKSAVHAAIPNPADVVADEKGDIYVLMDVGAGQQAVAKITNGNFVHVAGALPGEKSSINTGVNALFFRIQNATRLSVHDNKIFVLLRQAHQMIAIDELGITSLIVGSGDPNGEIGDEGMAIHAALNEPNDFAITAAGNLLIADTGHGRLRKVNFNILDQNSNMWFKGPNGYFDSKISFNGQSKEWSRTYSDQSKVLYSGTGKHLKTVDRNGNETVFHYDAEGLLERVIYPGGSIINFIYKAGLLKEMVDHAGRSTQFVMQDGQLVAAKLPTLQPRVFEYDAKGHLIKQLYSNGASTNYILDDFGRAIGFEAGTTSSDTILPPVQGEDNAGQVVIATSGKTVIKTEAGERSFKEENGHVTQMSGNGNDKVHVSHNKDGQIIRLMKQNQIGVENTYDEYGDLIKVQDLEGNSLQETLYNTNGQKIRETDPEGYVMRWEYDTGGNLINTFKGDMHIASYTYNAKGLLMEATEFGEKMTLEHDDSGNVTKVVNGDFIQEIVRSTTGQVLESKQGDFIHQIFEYDDLNRVVAIKEGEDIARYNYDQDGNRCLVVDALDNQYAYEYNAYGNLLSRSDLGSRAWHYEYDDRGRMIKLISPDGSISSWDYSSNGHHIKKYSENEITEIFQLDENRVSWMKNKLVQQHHEYDYQGELSNVRTLYENVGQSELAYSRKKNGMLEAIKSMNGQVEVNFDYTADGAVNKIACEQFEVQYIYNDIGQIIGQAFGKNQLMSMQYDDVGKLIQIKSADDSGVSFERNYQYYSSGDLSRISDENSDIWSFDYFENKGQLKEVELNGVKTSFAYDAIYNRLQGPNGTNEYTQDGDQLISDDHWTYEYDGNGNLISKTSKANSDLVHHYYYNSESKLVRFEISDGSVSAPLVKAKYSYDPSGRRIGKQLIYRDHPTKNSVRWYNYEGDNIFQEFDENFEVVRTYINNGIKGGILGFIENNKAYYFIKDIKQSVQKVIDEDGVVVAEYSYDWYGGATGHGPMADQIPVRFNSKWYDPESELYCFTARYYDPSTGRFTQPDPLFHEKPEGTFVANPYVYALGNPIRYSDPHGLDIWMDILAAVVVVVLSAILIAFTAATFGAGAGVAGVGFGMMVSEIFLSVFLGALFWGGVTGLAIGLGFGIYALANDKHFGRYFMRGFALGFTVGSSIYLGVSAVQYNILNMAKAFPALTGNPLSWIKFAKIALGFGTQFLIGFAGAWIFYDFMTWLFTSKVDGPSPSMKDANTCADLCALSNLGFAEMYPKIPDGFTLHAIGTRSAEMANIKTFLEESNISDVTMMEMADDSDGYEVYTMLFSDAENLYAVFRGARGFSDHFRTFDVFMDYHHDVQVNPSVINAINSILPQMLIQIQTLKGLNPNAQLFVTGHSSGGSMATKLVFDLYDHDITANGLYTFGAPRTGNEDFADVMSIRIPSSFRFVYSGDSYPTLPPRVFGFHHINSEVSINDGTTDPPGSLKGDPANPNIDFGLKTLWDSEDYKAWLESMLNINSYELTHGIDKYQAKIKLIYEAHVKPLEN